MCEADFNQLKNADFITGVERLYGPIPVSFNAQGTAAHSQFYPCHAQVVVFSPYYKGGRDRDVSKAASIAKEAWGRDRGVVFHCNQTFNRDILACIAAFTVAFNCVPQGRKIIF